MPSTQFSHAALSSAAGIDTAWTGLQRTDTWATIAGIQDISRPDFDASGNLEAFLFNAVVAGKTYPGKANVRLSSRPTDMVVAISTSEIMGQIATNLSANHSGVTVHVTLDLQSRGLLSTMMFPVIAAAVNDGLPHQIEQFAAQLSSHPDSFDAHG